MAARVCGANPIAAMDINDYKLKKARELGATNIINSKLKIINEKFNIICPGGFDVAVDTTGIKEIREMAYEITHATGRTVLVGVPPKGQKIEIDSFPLHFGKIVTGSHGGEANPTRDIPQLIKLEKTGAFDSHDLITHVYDLKHINDAINLVRSGNTIRVVVRLF